MQRVNYLVTVHDQKAASETPVSCNVALHCKFQKKLPGVTAIDDTVRLGKNKKI